MARAVPAIVLAVVITFTADHSAPLGFVTFGLFALIVGAILVAAGLRSETRSAVRSITLVQGVISILTGIVALVVPMAGLPFLVLLVSGFAAITGVVELYAGVRNRGRDRSARDGMFVGGLTLALAVLVLVVPPGLDQSFTGSDDVDRQLTASIVVVGALGAYWAVYGIYLVIAGLSLKWAPEQAEAKASQS